MNTCEWSSFVPASSIISLVCGELGYTVHESNEDRVLDLSAFVYEPNDSQVAQSVEAEGLELAPSQLPFASSSSSSQQMVVQTNAGICDGDRGILEVISSLDSALHDDECETVKGLSDDGHSYAGTVIRGVLRGDSE